MPRHRRARGLPAAARGGRPHAGADADGARRDRRPRRRASTPAPTTTSSSRSRCASCRRALRALLRRVEEPGDAGARASATSCSTRRPHEVAARRPARSSCRAPSSRCCELFLEHPRQVLTRTQLFERVWGYDFGATSNALGVYIGYLRRKTEAGGEPRLLHTVRGVGYVLREPLMAPAPRASRCSPPASVGITVVLASVVCYLAMRAELREQVDEALGRQAGRRARAARGERSPVRPTGSRARPGAVAARGRPGALRPGPRRRRQRHRPRRRRAARRSRSTARDRGSRPARRRATLSRPRRRTATHVRVLHGRAVGRRRGPARPQPARTSTRRSRSLRWCCSRCCVGGHRARGGARAAVRARR